MIGMEATQADSSGGSALTTVREIMSTELVTIEPSANLTEAVHAMSAGRSGSVLVLQVGTLVGIFTARDILRAWPTPPRRTWPGSHRSPNGYPEIR
jgi:CBS domain-containing protein